MKHHYLYDEIRISYIIPSAMWQGCYWASLTRKKPTQCWFSDNSKRISLLTSVRDWSAMKWTNGINKKYLAYFSSSVCLSSVIASANNFLSWASSSCSFAFLCTEKTQQQNQQPKQLLEDKSTAKLEGTARLYSSQAAWIASLSFDASEEAHKQWQVYSQLIWFSSTQNRKDFTFRAS